MSFVELIAQKRDGLALSRDQIAEAVQAATLGTAPPEQLAALLMAVCCRGMSDEETQWLTVEMLRSGEEWQLCRERPEAVDKHSTGGVGDTVSLVFAPLLVAVGVPVAMMAGRGLGHSQGTLDKLEAMPGFRCEWDRDGMLRLLDSCGAALIGQSERIAPADRVFYALRDVTATVLSLPLIVASIMSKKLALGAGTLVLDVKAGRGAFCKTVAQASELAVWLRRVAREAGVAAEALVTGMDQPLGRFLGNACEVRAALDVLSGRPGQEELQEVTMRLAEEAMVLRGWQRTSARANLERALASGAALEAWQRIVSTHGGDPDPDALASPTARVEVAASTAGFVVEIDAEALGWAAVDVGAGRRSRNEELAYGAGIEVCCRLGEPIERGQPLAILLLGDRPVEIEEMNRRVQAAFTIGDQPIRPPMTVLGTIDELVARSKDSARQNEEEA